MSHFYDMALGPWSCSAPARTRQCVSGIPLRVNGRDLWHSSSWSLSGKTLLPGSWSSAGRDGDLFQQIRNKTKLCGVMFMEGGGGDSRWSSRRQWWWGILRQKKNGDDDEFDEEDCRLVPSRKNVLYSILLPLLFDFMMNWGNVRKTLR